jgi:hypothetical protein
MILSKTGSLIAHLSGLKADDSDLLQKEMIKQI